MSKTKKPAMLLIRKCNPVRWVDCGSFATETEGWAKYERNIKGRGITAWAWCGPRIEAEEMLAGVKPEQEGSGDEG